MLRKEEKCHITISTVLQFHEECEGDVITPTKTGVRGDPKQLSTTIKHTLMSIVRTLYWSGGGDGDDDEKEEVEL